MTSAHLDSFVELEHRGHGKNEDAVVFGMTNTSLIHFTKSNQIDQ